MKLNKIICLALAACLALASCTRSPSPSTSPSPPVVSPTPTASPAEHGKGTTVYYYEAWNGMLSSLMLLGRYVGGEWEEWITGSSTEEKGRPITLHDAADISGGLPVPCKTPQVKLGDRIHLYTPDGYADYCSAVGIYFRHWSNTGISSIYLSTEDIGFPSEMPVLGFSDDNPDREIIPMEFDGNRGVVKADFDGDGEDETVEFEYYEEEQIFKRFLVKGDTRTELEPLECGDFSCVYACAVNIDGGDRYWLFERNTEMLTGYFAFSGWRDGGLEFLIKMAM